MSFNQPSDSVFAEDAISKITLEPSAEKRAMHLLVKSETNRFLSKGGIIDKITFGPPDKKHTQSVYYGRNRKRRGSE